MMDKTFISIISIFYVFYIVAAEHVPLDRIRAQINEQPIEETKDYKFQHVSYRTKNPVEAIKFYVEKLGMTLHDNIKNTRTETIYFLSYPNSGSTFYLELLHEWNYDGDLNTGNGNPFTEKGYSHIGIQVDDFEKAYNRFRSEGVTVLDHYKTENNGFIKDFDGYLIEINESPQHN